MKRTHFSASLCSETLAQFKQWLYQQQALTGQRVYANIVIEQALTEFIRRNTNNES